MIRWSKFATVYVLLLCAGLYLHLRQEAQVPLQQPLSTFPRQHAGWNLVGESRLSDGVLDVLQTTDYLYRQYARPDRPRISLYLGYHDGAQGRGGVHSPKHCLPGSGWERVFSRRMQLQVEQQQLPLVLAAYQRGGDKTLFLYWYQIQGRPLNDEYRLKLAEITNSLLHNRKDTALVRVSLPYTGNEREAVTAGVEFVRDFLPLLQSHLPR